MNRNEMLRQARLTAEAAHNHPGGVKGVQAAALAVFPAPTGHDKIKKYHTTLKSE
jgi:ADP-ribosylglycohydrolase